MPTRPLNRNRTGLVDLFGVALLLLFLVLFIYADRVQDESPVQLPQAWLNVSTIFLSIVLEAAPFVLLGVFVSALIQVYVHEEMLQRFLPKHPVKALIPATVMGAILPICECAIVPVVRRLIHKGMPLHCGVVFLVAAPILNPVVVASTFFAFRTNLEVLYARVGLAFLLAIVIGWVMYVVFRRTPQLKQTVRHVGSHQEEHQHQHQHNGHASPPFWHRLKQTLNHAADEFFDMGKYLIIGAFIAALFQTFLDRQILLSIGSGEWSSTLVMMAFAYVLSLCSEADAFVAASFGSMFTFGSIVAFLVYGPMLDLKNTILLVAYFKTRFVVVFMLTVTVIVFAAVMLLHLTGMGAGY